MADRIASQAVRLFNERRRRSEFFPEEMFSDHGWDLLIWLFIETQRGRRASTCDAARAINSTTQSTKRWIAALKQMALIDSRSCDESVMLAEAGHQRMVEFLSDMT